MMVPDASVVLLGSLFRPGQLGLVMETLSPMMNPSLADLISVSLAVKRLILVASILFSSSSLC